MHVTRMDLDDLGQPVARPVEGERFRIQLGPEQRLELYQEDGALVVLGSTGSLIIRPKAANVVSIRPEVAF